MQIDDLKDLGKLIDLCRKKGVDRIKVDNIEITLGDQPTSLSATKSANQSAAADQLPPEAYFPITSAVTMAIASEDLTEEELLGYSVREEVE